VIALLRTEFTKATRRARTWVIALLLIGLPSVIVIAIKAHGNRPRGNDSGDGLFRLAQQSGLLVPAAVLAVMSGFLLVVIAGALAGDPVAGDASTGNLRYLLMRPVPRGRLLVAKAIVAAILIWAATFLVAIAGLVAGLILFGSHTVVVPGVGSLSSLLGGHLATGFQLSPGTLVFRTFVATAYVAFGFTALLALGIFFSTLTDMAASAIGATIGVYIVSEILNAISQLGVIRYGFPTRYLDAWQTMFTDNTFSHEMIVGVIVQLAYLVVFGTAAIVWFRRKDIRS
jgi:ABC-2 type transport system permease protein